MGLKLVIVVALLLVISADVPSVSAGVGTGSCPYNINRKPPCRSDRDCGFSGMKCCPSSNGYDTCVQARTVG